MFKINRIFSTFKGLLDSCVESGPQTVPYPKSVENIPVLNSQPTVTERVRQPFEKEYVSVNKAEYIKLKTKVSYWKRQHERAVKRESDLKKELALKEAKIRDLQQRLFGKKSEKGKSRKGDKGNKSKDRVRRSRGQQKGSEGHGRTLRPYLPVIEEESDLKENCCPRCNAPYHVFPNTEDSETLEIKVKAHIRRVKRKKYIKSCQCEETPGIITAPAVPKLFPRNIIGISVWVETLLNKYLYSRPLNRICQDYGNLGMPISPGTLIGGMKRLSPLFEPLLDEMLEKQMTERLFHADETRWMVFEHIEGKIGYRWYLWVIKSSSVIYYRIAPGRSADVPIEHFSGLNEEIKQAILVCDRYSAYKRLAKECKVFLLAFCWSHVRRDFLDAAKSWPELEEWMFTWVEDIRELYRINDQRLEHWDETKSLNDQSADFTEQHLTLVDKLAKMDNRRKECQQKELHSAQSSVLESLKNHWSGLIIFVDHPAVPMDNNTSERSIRNPVTGRKAYYGSGSVWSAELASELFTLLQTVMLWGLNPRHWLFRFLSACAENGGKTPEDLDPFIPWKMEEDHRQELALPLLAMERDPPDRFEGKSGTIVFPKVYNTS